MFGSGGPLVPTWSEARGWGPPVRPLWLRAGEEARRRRKRGGKRTTLTKSITTVTWQVRKNQSKLQTQPHYQHAWEYHGMKLKHKRLYNQSRILQVTVFPTQATVVSNKGLQTSNMGPTWTQDEPQDQFRPQHGLSWLYKWGFQPAVSDTAGKKGVRRGITLPTWPKLALQVGLSTSCIRYSWQKRGP